MKNNKRLEYGKLLAKMRCYRNMTQKQLAEKCGFPQSTIARIETGKTSPGLDTLLIIEEVLNFERIYINKNKIIMGTSSFMFGSTNNTAFYEVIKDLPCFSIVELSKNQANVTATWNPDYISQFDDDKWEEICNILSKTEWCDGNPEDYPDGSKVWWFEEEVSDEEYSKEDIAWIEKDYEELKEWV